MARSTITRTGRQRIALTAGPSAAADVLSDLEQVTEMLGTLLDQERCTLTPVPRWTLPELHVGPKALHVAVTPTIERLGDDVDIVARSLPDSDARVTLTLATRPTPDPAGVTLLTTSWRLVLGLPVPRAMLVLLTPAIDVSVKRIVADVMRRTAAAVV